MSNRPKKQIPISRCIKRTWSYQNFKVTGHPYWELWNEILHSAQIETKNRIREVNSVKSVNSRPKDKDSNTNDNR